MLLIFFYFGSETKSLPSNKITAVIQSCGALVARSEPTLLISSYISSAHRSSPVLQVCSLAATFSSHANLAMYLMKFSHELRLCKFFFWVCTVNPLL